MKKLSIIIIISIIFVTGCNDKKVVAEDTREATAITNKVEEKVLEKNNNIEYDFKTSKYNIIVETKYNSGYKLNGKYLESKFYKVNAYTEEYTIPYFNSQKEAATEDDIFKVSGYEAIRLITDIKVMVLVKIDDETIIYIVGDSEGRCMAEEIRDDNDFKDLLNNVKITVKKK